MTWILFSGITLVIVYGGIQLSRYGDILAEKTGLGRTWIGLVLVAATTSLPELFTGIGSTAVFDLPDIAVGDVLGSCMFNLLILSLADAVGGKVPISARAHQGHALAIGFGSLLMGLVGLSLVAGARAPTLGWIGGYTPLFVLVYLLAMRTIFSYERKRLARDIERVAEKLQYAEVSLRAAVFHYAVNALLVIAAAIYLPHLGEAIAHETGLGQSFVGTLFIAAATSLPELVVSLAAVRMGAVDLAFGNILGSNIFNILILGLDDVFYVGGPLLAVVSPSHLIPVMAVVLMNAIVLTGLTYQAIHKRLVLGWDTWGILVVYFGATLLLYTAE